MPTTLGQRVLAIREERGLSLRLLGERVGLSASFLSQVERDEVSPSIGSLEKIARGLGADLASLFEARASHPITRAADRPALSSGWSQATVERLSSQRTRLDPRLLTLGEPESKSGVLLTQGETFALVLEGRVMVRLGDDDHTLEAGDSLHALPEHAFSEIRNQAQGLSRILLVIAAL